MENSKVILFLVVAIVITKITTFYVDNVRYSYKCETPLHDALHTRLPNLRRYGRYIDIVPILLGVAVLYLYIYEHLDQELIRDAIIFFSIILIFRAILYSATILPSSFCMKGIKNIAVGGCHDCICSGHTILTLLLAYVLYQHNPQYQTALMVYCILSSLFIIATRSHYTIDVLISYIVVYAFLKDDSTP